jgi:protein-L-isoaspartate(D-aspartate) O-methyltransferase
MSDRVEAAFAAVPRIGFLPPDQKRYVDNDTALPIGYGVTNSQPSTVRAMLRLLDVQPGDRVLDVGSGSGWTTALLAHLAGATGYVVGVERIPEVLAIGRENLTTVPDRSELAATEMHLAVPGVLGWRDAAPYDRILVSAGADEIPEQLVAQLADPAVMVIPVRGDMLRVTRAGNQARAERHGRYVFVPLIEQ